MPKTGMGVPNKGLVITIHRISQLVTATTVIDEVKFIFFSKLKSSQQFCFAEAILRKRFVQGTNSFSP